LCLAALTAGLATSMAQTSNVYSLNIVGYANVPNPIGYTFQSAPFSSGVSNGANEVLPANTGQNDGDQVLIWTGHAWASRNLDSTSPTGFSDDNGFPVNAPILGAFLGYLYYNSSVTLNNIAYVGNVRTTPGNTISTN